MQKMIAQEKIITRIVKQRVAETFRELLQDPDAGLALRPKAERALRKSLQSKQEGKMRDLVKALKSF